MRIKGLVNLLHGGNGMYVDRFVTGRRSRHAAAARQRQRAAADQPGEQILVEPGGFLYKDSTVQMQAAQMPLKTGMLRHGMYLAEMARAGPGWHPVMYVHHDAD